MCYIRGVNGADVKDARLALSLTQNDAALKLGVTQAYLSMIESGSRPVSMELALKALDVFQIPATALPLGNYKRGSRDEFSYKRALGTLGYSGFAYLRESVKSNPAALLMDALDSEDLDSRVIEALPWLPLAYPKLNWEWLMLNAKMRDRQNRLAFVVTLGREAAAKTNDVALEKTLAERVATLERSRLAVEDTLCKESMTQAERKWVRTHRTKAAKHWNLLTDLTLEQLDHVFA
jgi:transcriptional regulator with XRE-family HTH domain